MSSDSSDSDYIDLIHRLREGDDAALGALLNEYRDWLKDIASKRLDGRVAGRLDASDIVQQTLLSAIRQIEGFVGQTHADFRVWLAQIHKRNIEDQLRRHTVAEKRSVRKERSATALHSVEDEKAEPPSHAIRQAEQIAELNQRLDALPSDQAEAVRLRHLNGWTMEELSIHFGRSNVAVAALLKRGLENLRKQALTDEN